MPVLRIRESFTMLPEISCILDHPDFLSMRNYRHHGDVDCLSHCLRVAEKAFTMALRFKADVVSTLRGALLHDFYLYDWHGDGVLPLHGLHHPYTALHEAEIRFRLNKKEIDSIKKHMFPLTPFPPLYLESWIVNLADKISAASDYAGMINLQKAAEGEVTKVSLTIRE